MLKIIRKNIIAIILVSLIYLIYTSVFIKPWQFRSFSFVDDGQVFAQNYSYIEKCIKGGGCYKFLDQTFEFGPGRLRPAYWLLQGGIYGIFQNNPQLIHEFRVYVTGYVVVILFLFTMLDLGVSLPIILPLTLIFINTISFSENIIRLGPNEPYQVIFVAILSLLYLRKIVDTKNMKGVIILLLITLWTLFIKENNLAIIPAIFVSGFVIVDRKNKFFKILLITILPVAVFFILMYIKKYLPSTIVQDIPAYVSNYSLNPSLLFENFHSNYQLLLNSLSPLLKISFVLLILTIIVKKLREKILNIKFIYWLILSISFFGILIPWAYVLNRYHLVTIFCLLIVIAYLINVIYIYFYDYLSIKINNRYVKLIYPVCVFVLILNLSVKGFALNLAQTINYQTWFSTFTQFEGDQIKSIAKYNSDNIKINALGILDNWEYLYEIPIHLRYIYGLTPHTSLLDKNEISGYIFSRNAIKYTVELDSLKNTKSVLLDHRSYAIDQIDILKFRDLFIQKPLQTLTKPPLYEQGIPYYWEIRKIN